MGEHVYCERRSMYRKNELFKELFKKQNFFTTNLNPVMSGGGKSSNILDQTYSF